MLLDNSGLCETARQQQWSGADRVAQRLLWVEQPDSRQLISNDDSAVGNAEGIDGDDDGKYDEDGSDDVVEADNM